MNVYNRSESFVRFVNMKKSPFKTSSSMTFTALDNMLSMEPYYSFPHPHPRFRRDGFSFSLRAHMLQGMWELRGSTTGKQRGLTVAEAVRAWVGQRRSAEK